MPGRDPHHPFGPGDVAIIGIGCRYPGAADAAAFWKLLNEGRDAIGVYPGSRFPEIDAAYEEFRRTGKRIATDRGGFLPGIDLFDARFFEVSPREAVHMDPQQRLLIEATWDALCDAGQIRETWQGSCTAVFMGLWSNDFESNLHASGAELDFYVTTGGGRAAAAGRISYVFGFEGPSVVLDSACSSSLVAVHLACKSLISGESNMALAGGANIILSTAMTEMFTPAEMLSRDGRCKFGDLSADGFVRSEGIGVVVLKRLSDAIAANDPIYAVIRGSAVNSDGRTNGLMMTPSIPGQRQMLRQAWKNAGIDPKDLVYLEAHGTGTRVGDAAELQAMAEELAASGVAAPCPVGSLKSNIGHTEAAAGIGGLIKAALALKHRRIPRSLHCHTPNPKIDWNAAPLRILTEPLDLIGSEEPLLVGVSSFSLTGTNAHAVLQAWDEPEKPQPHNAPCLFVTSAHTPEALEEVLRTNLEFVCGDGQTLSLHDLCFTAAARRSHHEFRTAIAAANQEELRAHLEAALRQEARSEIAAAAAKPGKRRIVFVCPGQGSQWAGMARELFTSEPAFRSRFEELDAAILAETGWSLIERVLGADAASHLEQIDVVQPALFSVSVALASLWQAWGIEPDAVVGHSMGEVAAACISGSLSLRDAVAVICRRSRLMKTLRGSGAMATVDLSIAEAERLVQASGGSISIAASNSPSATILAGDARAIDKLLLDLERRDIFARRINVDVASHSAQVDPILDALREQLQDITPQPAQKPMLSTVTGRMLQGSELTAEYWARNLRQPVLFARGVETLAGAGHDVFIELSPHPVLLPASAATLQTSHPDAVIVPCLRRGKPEQISMLAALGTLYSAGHAIDWSRIFPDGGTCVPLPAYPFQRERYWPGIESDTRPRLRAAAPGHRYGPLLRQRFVSATDPDTILWQPELDLTVHPWLSDHRVLASPVLPAAAHIELALEAIGAECPGEPFTIHGLTLSNAAYLEEAATSQEFQLILRRERDAYRFELRSRANSTDAAWTLHSSGTLRRAEKTTSNTPVDLSATSRIGIHHEAAEHYRSMTRRGLEYGPAFQRFEESWLHDNQLVARIRSGAEAGYRIHPALLDACFQSMLQFLSGHAASSDAWLPSAIGAVQVTGEIPTEHSSEELFVFASLTKFDPKAGHICVDMRLVTTTGSVIAIITGLEARRAAPASSLDSESLFTIDWQHVVTNRAPVVNVSADHCILFADQNGVADRLAAQLISRGASCTLIRHTAGTTPETIDALHQCACDNAPSAVIHLSSLDEADASSLTSILAAQQSGSHHLPAIVRAIQSAEWKIPPRLWTVTASAVPVSADDLSRLSIASAPLHGLARVIAWEHPELQPVLADLSASPSDAELAHLADRILSNETETQIAFRGHTQFAVRFAHHPAPAAEEASPLRDNECYRIEMSRTGLFDHLQLRAFEPPQPGLGEIAIEITAAALNVIDITRAMGTYPGIDPNDPVSLGTECAGRVIAIGEGVTNFRTGDEVVAITPRTTTIGLLASHAVLPEHVITRKPVHLSFEEAAAAPVAFLTAWHALVELAHLKAGEWVLIHAASGGVGLACIEIARKAGAKIIGTASSPEKHAWLHSIGIEHVFSSRTLDFAGEIMRITDGRGVDVVINSLSGDLLSRSLELLAPWGRFIELGKRDLYEDRRIGLKPLRRNISYHTVDLAFAVEERPAYMQQMLQSVMSRLASGEWKPLPVEVFSSAEPAVPFRHLALAKHIGKVVLAMHRDVRVLPSTEKPLFSREATYLITGGLGGVGTTLAAWMAEQGAGHIILASRRSPSPETQSIVERIEQHGAKVTHAQLDVQDAQQVRNLIRTIQETLPPLRGIMHAAVVIDDALVADLTPERFAAVEGPKIAGAFNLHEATRDHALDFFVFFSSIAAVIPQAGHGSYAASNAFMDAFAHHLRTQGVPAISINWGGWQDTGLIREAGTARSLKGYEALGIPAFTPPQALEALREALITRPTQTIAMRLDADRFTAFHAQSGIPSAFSKLAENWNTQPAQSNAAHGIRETLASAETPAQRTAALRAWLQQELGRVMKLAPERISPDRPLGTLGMDSLMALEFVRRLNGGLGIGLPATAVFNYPTVIQLADQVAQRLHWETAPEPASPVHDSLLNAINEIEALQAIESLSDEEALALLTESGEEHHGR